MPPHVFAYLDLASGSMIVQAVIAGIVVVPVLMRNKIRALFGRSKSTEAANLASDVESSATDVATDAAGSDRT
jgi:hypothetical protein